MLIFGILVCYGIALIAFTAAFGRTVGSFVQCTVMYFMCIYVLKQIRVIDASKGAKLAEQSKQKYQTEQNYKNTILHLLEWCETIVHRVGAEPRDTDIYEWNFIISRCFKELPYIHRRMKATELLGIIRGVQFLCIVGGIYGFVMTFNSIFFAFVLGAFAVPVVLRTLFQGVIKLQDEELEHDFPDLYLLLYVRLTAGVNGHIASSLSSYIANMNALYAKDQHTVIRQFAQDLRNLIEIWGSEPMAISKVRENYRSAMVVNFCNLAIQSLNGVDTKDKLLAFKVELNEKQRELMTREAAARVEKGRRSIYAIYLILGEFIVVSWAAKIF